MKIDFEFTTQYGVFRDAIYLQDDHDLTEQQIQEIKQQRLNNWIAVFEAPPQEDIVESTLQEPQNTIEIAGEMYQKLEGIPQSGAKLIEVNGTWYFKVQ
jgi:hypothetical protein